MVGGMYAVLAAKSAPGGLLRCRLVFWIGHELGEATVWSRVARLDARARHSALRRCYAMSRQLSRQPRLTVSKRILAHKRDGAAFPVTGPSYGELESKTFQTELAQLLIISIFGDFYTE